MSILTHAGDVDYKVIVIDNASEDGSSEMVKKSFPQVTLIENSENRGYAAACNQGMRIAVGKYVLLLNSDVLICDSSVEKTVNYADKRPQTAVVSCQVWESQDKIMMTCFRFPSITNLILSASGLSKLFMYNRVFGREWMRWWKRDSERQVDVVPGVFMLVRREAIDQVGLMDEEYFFYSEEVDWCYRFSKAGWTTMFWPGAKIIHVGGGAQSSKKTPEKSYVLLVKGKLCFFKKNHGFMSYLLARGIFIVLFGLKYCLWTVASITSGKREVNTVYRLERRKALWALKFTAFGIEPGKSGS
jgi:GT2 family glycosyltransferase